jgi:uncharacterized protein (TIGR01777 family)
MHILLTGGTGFIGSALCDRLRDGGHCLTVLSRRPSAGKTQDRYVTSLDDIDAGESIDALINLAGASLAEKRWTAAYKREIIDSRIETTRALLGLVERLERKPHTLLSASAIGYYGHHDDEVLDENGAATPGFAQDLCRRWENLALTARDQGVRVCLLRLGVVFDRRGGAFARMALPYKFGMGNWMGSGRQWLSWVHRGDVVRATQFLLERSDLSGPFNVTAPGPVTSRGFNDAMQRHTRVWFSAPVPAAVMRLALGEMADELLLNGQRVVPAALERAGFEFEYPDIDSALDALFL